MVNDQKNITLKQLFSHRKKIYTRKFIKLRKEYAGQRTSCIQFVSEIRQQIQWHS